MTPTTTRRAFQVLALAGLSATGALPARAAVIQSAPIQAVFATDLAFVPISRRELNFDAGLGTLNSVTLSFDGRISVAVGGPISDEPPYPATVPATVTVRAAWNVQTALEPIALDLTVRDIPAGTDAGPARTSASVSGEATRAFSLTISGGSYEYTSLHTDYRVPGLSLIGPPASYSDAFFRGTVTAVFDYTALDADTGNGATNVPEPVGLAVLGIGLLSLAAARRRVA